LPTTRNTSPNNPIRTPLQSPYNTASPTTMSYQLKEVLAMVSTAIMSVTVTKPAGEFDKIPAATFATGNVFALSSLRKLRQTSSRHSRRRK